ncbi:hypothetical protein JCM16814_09240 [Desulfobaculum senezii]
MNKFLSRLWSVSALLPLAILGLILAAQTLPSLDTRALWFSDEIRYANVFEHVIDAHKWLVMYLNGVPYPDKPPVYFWFLTAFLPIFGGAKPALFFAGAAASALVVLVGMLCMNHLVLKGGRENGLAAGLILLTCFYFVALTHYSRMDLLFTGLITFSHICLFRAWQQERAMGWTVAGFVLAALATLTKGPLGLVFPVLASVVYLAWSGRLSRLVRRDVLVGFGAAVVILIGWIAAAWFSGEHALVENIFYKQIYRRAVDASHHEQPFWHYFATFPAAFLPWTFVVVLLPFKRLFTLSFWKELWYARKADVCSTGSGLSYLWCALISGFVLLTCLSTKIVVYLMPLFPILALLTARTVLGFDAARTRKLVLFVAGLFAVLGVGVALANLFTQWPIVLKGIYVLAVVNIIIAALLWRFVSRWDIRPALLTLGILMTIWVQPLAFIAVPELDAVMSPKEQGELMGEYIADGYTPAAYKIYSGVYTYYCGTNILETQDLPRLAEMARTEDKFVLGMQRRYWDSWDNRPANLRVVHEQWVVDRPYVLLVNTPEGGAPAEAPAPETTPVLEQNATQPAPTPQPKAAPAPSAPAVQPAPVQPPAAPEAPKAAPAPAPQQTAPAGNTTSAPASNAPGATVTVGGNDGAMDMPATTGPGLTTAPAEANATPGALAKTWAAITDTFSEFWETWNTPEGEVKKDNEGTGMFKSAMKWLSDVTKGGAAEEDILPADTLPATAPNATIPNATDSSALPGVAPAPADDAIAPEGDAVRPVTLPATIAPESAPKQAPSAATENEAQDEQSNAAPAGEATPAQDDQSALPTAPAAPEASVVDKAAPATTNEASEAAAPQAPSAPAQSATNG